MKVEIWSDVMCPFCYIGKRHFEEALRGLPFAAALEVEWKSFQLNPGYHNTEKQGVYAYLAENKGISEAQARQMTTQVRQMGQAAGIDLDFDKNIPANTFDAHRLIHLAAGLGLQDAAEEALFEAHFSGQADIADHETLAVIGQRMGIDLQVVRNMLQSEDFAGAVRKDVHEAQQLGISGVPYFVMDRKFGLSGAQPVAAFKQALQQGYADWKSRQPQTALQDLGAGDGPACGENGCA
ncbi:disulfide bond formation protein DsbA [Pedobacter yulinensis]|uniref:Disulfide bond formation protein DsbA n=1 Tax=Pedobacter yulinensis TaxID=2126353 RepID=A0A2T3HRN6_9SPHI|nr:DsbA family oxidoreductase [Pedobacter yulinensis]PST85047.1 disulfide bond formation protein DsbA [Pedobacter yulinensis]